MSAPVPTLFGFAEGYQRSQVTYTVVKYGFADFLKDGPKTGEELAGLAKTDQGRTSRILRFAATMGLFDRDPETLKYSLNDVSRVLVEQPYFKGILLHLSNPHTVQAWTGLPKSIEGGAYPHKALFGGGMFEYQQAHPEEGEEFNKAMTSLSSLMPLPGSFAKAYDFSMAKHVIDVGGGHGFLLTEILLEHPHLTGTTFDLASTIEETKNVANLPKDFSKVQSRFSFAAGSFLESVPEGGDIYTLKYIIHDWPDAEAVKILQNIHKVLPAHGKVVVIEVGLEEVNDRQGCMLDLHMLVLLDGVERTKEGFTALFKKAGFKVTNFIPLPANSSAKMFAIEGEKL